jgi:hypothetical protein
MLCASSKIAPFTDKVYVIGVFMRFAVDFFPTFWPKAGAYGAVLVCTRLVRNVSFPGLLVLLAVDWPSLHGPKSGNAAGTAWCFALVRHFSENFCICTAVTDSFVENRYVTAFRGEIV